MSRSVKLSPDVQWFAEEQVAAGNFRNLDEVAEAAFALLRDSLRRDAARGELARLFAEMDAGRGIPTTSGEFARMADGIAARCEDQ